MGLQYSNTAQTSPWPLATFTVRSDLRLKLMKTDKLSEIKRKTDKIPFLWRFYLHKSLVTLCNLISIFCLVASTYFIFLPQLMLLIMHLLTVLNCYSFRHKFVTNKNKVFS